MTGLCSIGGVAMQKRRVYYHVTKVRDPFSWAARAPRQSRASTPTHRCGTAGCGPAGAGARGRAQAERCPAKGERLGRGTPAGVAPCPDSPHPLPPRAERGRAADPHRKANRCVSQIRPSCVRRAGPVRPTGEPAPAAGGGTRGVRGTPGPRQTTRTKATTTDPPGGCPHGGPACGEAAAARGRRRTDGRTDGQCPPCGASPDGRASPAARSRPLSPYLSPSPPCDDDGDAHRKGQGKARTTSRRPPDGGDRGVPACVAMAAVRGTPGRCPSAARIVGCGKRQQQQQRRPSLCPGRCVT